jgi:LacI family transcriptional regulator
MEATQHLVDMGCRKIAHIRGPNPQNAIDRFIGYKRL